MKHIITFILMLNSLQNLHAKQKDPTAISVNGDEIKLSTFTQTYNQNKLFVGTERVTKKKVMNDLINRQLGIQRAKKNKIQKDPEVRRKIEDILYHAQISKDLENEFKKIKVSESDVKKYYSNHKEFRTAHILIRLPANPTIEASKAAQKKIFDIYDQIKKSPNKFSALAERYSQVSVAPSGGDLGFQPATKLAPEYFNAIKNKGVNHITPPVRTQYGYHIIKILAIKDFKSIHKNLYYKIVYDTKRDKIIAKYFENLRKNASIKISENLLK